MKDDLHELIDGGLPDEQAAELLHLLSVDPEKRTMFRHQMRLQQSLCRNERHAGLSALEEGEMLDRISRVVGEPTPGAGRFARRGVLMLAIGFLVGSGAGYAGHSLMSGPSVADGGPDTVRVVQQAPTPAPVVVNINRDSLVTAISDSLKAAQAAAAKTTPKRTAKAPAKRRNTPAYMGDPTTGARIRKK